MPPPDADLHPEATGPAKELVDQHRTPQPLRLYAGWFCPFGMALNMFNTRYWTLIPNSAKGLGCPGGEKYPLSVH